MLNGSNKVYLNRSQPPYLSMMVADIYKKSKDVKWLSEAVALLEVEYGFWMKERMTPIGLNRYSSAATVQEKIGMANYLKERFNDPNLLKGLSEQEIITMGSHFTAEAESGWDFNPRFLNRCEDFIPVDLNSNLYIYETNFAWFAKELKKNSDVGKWEKRAEARKKLINKYCYDKGQNMFYDYDFVNKKRSDVTSAAVFSLLFSKVATPLQAKGIVKELPKLETNYGLRATESKLYGKTYQWGETNGWAPLHFIAVKGLENYGFVNASKRIGDKYVSTIYYNFTKTNNLWEKYNIVDGTVNTSNEYQMPAFLGWTAGVFLYLVKDKK
ncbi:Periplasmic trehalase precursor [compost metagenome]